MAIDVSKYQAKNIETQPVNSTDFSKYGSIVSNTNLQNQPNSIPEKIYSGLTTLTKPLQQGVSSLLSSYGGGEQGIATKLSQDIQSGSADISQGNFVKGAVKSGFRTAGDVAGLVYAPVATALNATGINKVFDYLGELSQKGGKYNPINAITDMKSVQNFVTNHPNLEEDFGRALNLAFAKADSGNIDPKTIVDRTIKQYETGVDTIKSLTSKSESQIESSILKNYEKGVKPTIVGKKTQTQVQKYRDDVISAVKTIKDNKDNLSFTDEYGSNITGQSPETLQQTADAIEQTKKVIFNKYDALSKTAGEAGVTVPVQEIATELNPIIQSKSLAITNPKAIQYAKELQTRLTDVGALDASTAQEVIQNYNKSLEAFYKNPSYDNASQAAIDSLIANRMRKLLDEGITKLTGEQYQSLKNQYGALKSIESDVVKATIRDARKNIKGIIDFTDIFSGGQVVNGILNLNPGQIASGLTQKAMAEFYKYLNNPNRAIKNMFNQVENLKSDVGSTLEQKSLQKYNSDKQSLLNEYINKNGKIVNTDNARPLFSDIGYNGTNAASVQEASSLLSKDAWRYNLSKNPESDAVLYAGSSGSGKTTAVQGLIPDINKHSAAVLDSNLSKLSSAMSRIKEAVDAGKKPKIVYVWREPSDAWINGVIKRMISSPTEKGRVVPLSVFLDNLKGSRDVTKILRESGFDVKMIDNSLGAGKQTWLSEEKFNSIKIPENLKETLLNKTKQLYESGKITKEQYDALIK